MEFKISNIKNYTYFSILLFLLILVLVKMSEVNAYLNDSLINKYDCLKEYHNVDNDYTPILYDNNLEYENIIYYNLLSYILHTCAIFILYLFSIIFENWYNNQIYYL